MKRQSITPAALTSPASLSLTKGLQQYFTPEPWARALAAALPSFRRSLLDLHCGNGSLLRGVATPETREVMALDLDPAAHPGKPKQWEPIGCDPIFSHFTGDVLDLYPLLIETNTRFDLILANPPFSLNWPVKLLHETLAQGLDGKTSLDSTHATLRMLPHLMSTNGEAMLIANASTLNLLHNKYPSCFEHAWLLLDIPNFFPGVGFRPEQEKAFRIGVLYLSGNHTNGPETQTFITPLTPDRLATALDSARRDLFKARCITQPWDASAASRYFDACGDEMIRRNDPSHSRDNVTLATDGRIRTHVSLFQERSSTIDARLSSFLHSLNRKHPLELTLQRGTRLALQEVIDSGLWSISPDARQAIDSALASFNQDRAPLSPVSTIQRIGWIDDAEELLCIETIDHFQAGEKYKLSTETIEWKKEESRPRYHAGKRSQETILVRGTDLRITLHHPTLNPIHFIFNPDRAGTLHTTRSLEDLARHFQLPDAPDITAIHPEAFARNLALLDELEALTP
jgi:hypothetical protein